MEYIEVKDPMLIKFKTTVTLSPFQEDFLKSLERAMKNIHHTSYGMRQRTLSTRARNKIASTTESKNKKNTMLPLPLKDPDLIKLAVGEINFNKSLEESFQKGMCSITLPQKFDVSSKVDEIFMIDEIENSCCPYKITNINFDPLYNLNCSESINAKCRSNSKKLRIRRNINIDIDDLFLGESAIMPENTEEEKKYGGPVLDTERLGFIVPYEISQLRKFFEVDEGKEDITKELWRKFGTENTRWQKLWTQWSIAAAKMRYSKTENFPLRKETWYDWTWSEVPLYQNIESELLNEHSKSSLSRILCREYSNDNEKFDCSSRWKRSWTGQKEYSYSYSKYSNSFLPWTQYKWTGKSGWWTGREKDNMKKPYSFVPWSRNGWTKFSSLRYMNKTYVNGVKKSYSFVPWSRREWTQWSKSLTKNTGYTNRVWRLFQSFVPCSQAVWYSPTKSWMARKDNYKNDGNLTSSHAEVRLSWPNRSWGKPSLKYSTQWAKRMYGEWITSSTSAPFLDGVWVKLKNRSTTETTPYWFDSEEVCSYKLLGDLIISRHQTSTKIQSSSSDNDVKKPPPLFKFHTSKITSAITFENETEELKMPKNKKPSSDSSDSDSGPEDRTPPRKKPAPASSKKSAASEEEEGWHLGNNRFVKVREFRGKLMVDIREFYEKNGELLPGKKGIALSATQWKKFKDLVDEIDEKLSEKA